MAMMEGEWRNLKYDLEYGHADFEQIRLRNVVLCEPPLWACFESQMNFNNSRSIARTSCAIAEELHASGADHQHKFRHVFLSIHGPQDAHGPAPH